MYFANSVVKSSCEVKPINFFNTFPLASSKIELGLIIKAKCALECICVGIVGIKIGKLDFAKIFRFKPMNHGRHCAAGTSGKAEKFHQLQLTGCQADRGRVGGFQVGSA